MALKRVLIFIFAVKYIRQIYYEIIEVQIEILMIKTVSV